MARPLTVLKWLSLLGGLALGVESHCTSWRPLHLWVTPVLQPAFTLLGEHVLSGLTAHLLLVLDDVLGLISWMLARSWSSR